MVTIKHPIQGRPTLEWEDTGACKTAHSLSTAKYTRGSAYKVRELFALVRPTYNSLGLFCVDDVGWVVTRNDFDDIREFKDWATAKLYVESLFALEYNG